MNSAKLAPPCRMSAGRRVNIVAPHRGGWVRACRIVLAN
jgi:hypothetical protein